MEEIQTSRLTDKFGKQSTSDSDTVSRQNFLFLDLNSPSRFQKSPKSRDKEKLILSIIENELSVEKSEYSFSSCLTEEIKRYLNSYYMKNIKEEFIRQNNYLIRLNKINTTLQINGCIAKSFNEENQKEIYIRIKDINENDIFVSKSEIDDIIKDNSQPIGRNELYDIKGTFHIINLYNFIAKKYLQEILFHDNSSIDNLIESQSLSFTSLPLPQNVSIGDTVELFDIHGSVIEIKKCFIKHLINKIIHGLPLPLEETVVDIEGKIKVIEPNNINTYIKLVQLSNIGEILFSEDNKYFAAYDINSNKRFVNTRICNTRKIYSSNNEIVKLSSISRQSSSTVNSQYLTTVSMFKKRELNQSYEHSSKTNLNYLKLYDVNNNSFLIPEDKIIKIYEQLLNRESIYFKQTIKIDKGQEVTLNLYKIRARPQNYTDESPTGERDIPYEINNEENISYFEVTNCFKGNKLLMKTETIFSLIKSNIGKDFITIKAEKPLKICIEELKDILKVDNKQNEYIKIANVSNKDSFIKKRDIFQYIEKLIENTQINSILSTKDNKSKPQYFDMKQICKNNLSIIPSPYNDKFCILQISSNTYIQAHQGFIAVNYSTKNELFEFMKVEDENNDTFYIRKPYIRNILYQSYKNNSRLPEKVELHDLNHKKRRLMLRSYIKTLRRTKAKFGNIKVAFNVKEVYIELILPDRKVIVSEKELESFIHKFKSREVSTMRDNRKKLFKTINGKLVEIHYSNIKRDNLKRKWILIKDVNNEYALVYKASIKFLICTELFDKKNDAHKSIVEVYDYYCQKRQIDTHKLTMNYIIQKSLIKEDKRILIEVYNKTSNYCLS